ncbi:hypothetical protein FACS189485_03160 [Spirochaetia bacterium]|nr:hypothetical protein FACS189485_03160 [Spirochaetia bacterium]
MAKFKVPDGSLASGGKDSSIFNGKAAEGTLKEGVRLFNMKRWELAQQEFLRINTEKLIPEENTDLAYYLGLCYTKLARYEDALLYLEQVIPVSQDVLRVFQCRMTLAYIYVITRRFKMAEFELHKLQGNGFESAQLYTTLGYAAWLQKHIKESVEFYEKALEMDENNTTAMNCLGYILSDTNMDLVRGLRLCRKAVDLKPQNPAYVDSLGWTYFKSGDVAEARVWLRRALDMAPNEKEIRDHFRAANGDSVL